MFFTIQQDRSISYLIMLVKNFLTDKVYTLNCHVYTVLSTCYIAAMQSVHCRVYLLYRSDAISTLPRVHAIPQRCNQYTAACT